MPPSLRNDVGSDAPRVYIDLTDVIVHGMWHSTIGGIVRVQLDVACALVRDPNVVPFSFADHRWRDLRPLFERAHFDSNTLFARIHEKFFYRRERPRWGDPCHLARLAGARLAAFAERLRSRRPNVRAGDTLLVGGVFWMNRDMLDLIAQAAENGVRLVVLIHDLIPFTAPQFTGRDFTPEYREVLSREAHFVATTQLTKTEIETARAQIRGKSEPDAITIIPLAEEFPGAKRNEAPSRMTQRLKPLATRPFVLYVSTVEVRKNHATLMEAWAELAAEMGDRLPRLVVAGRRGWEAEETLRKLDALRDQESPIVFVEGPSQDEVRWLYAACLFTVFPSFFEGWGLPVGEGFWFGKTCAASNTSSIPTVGRDLCEYFSPSDKEGMKSAIRRLLDPEVRGVYEAKIAASSLRTWEEVGADFARLVLGARGH